MESRFTFKDFVFVVLFVVVIGAVVWSIYQSGYQESRLNDLKKEVVQLGDNQKQQIEVLSDIRNTLKAGIRVNANASQGSAGTSTAGAVATTEATEEHPGRIRRTNPDGSTYVYYPDPPTAARDPTTQPDYATGDWLVQNLESEPKVIAPYIPKDYVGQEVQQPVLESMVGQNPETFEFEPVLAESYWTSADGLTMRFKLRSNINFSDGTPVTVEDVIFSFNTIMTPGVDCAPLRSYFDKVKSCKKVDDRTVEFQMSEPYFLALSFIGGISIIPEHVYKFQNPDDFNRHSDLLVGTGPYKVEKWDRGQELVLVRNDRYWGQRATFDRLIFKFLTNEQAAFQEFQDSQIDRFEPTGDQYAKFTSDPDFMKQFQAYKYLRVNSGWAFIGWNLKKPMFKDKETRRALSMLLDKPAMIDTLIKKMGEPQAGPINPLSKAHDPTVLPIPYDPEGAKKLLAGAGWQAGADGVLARDGVRFEFDLSMGAGSPMMERLANYIKNQYATAGIRMNITPWEFSVLNQRLDERNFDAVTMSWMAGSAEDDPYQIWDSASIADKGSNCISWDNKESDRLIEEARRTLDDKKRLELWHKWERLIVDEEPYCFLWTRYDRMFVNGRFRNTKPYKLDAIPYDWFVPTALQKYH
jgi:peptide/nickel transport system substrate-binding protein